MISPTFKRRVVGLIALCIAAITVTNQAGSATGVTVSGATSAASCLIDKDNNFKNKGVYKNADVDRDKYDTPPTSPDVIVNFDTTRETPLNPGFSGFNSNLQNAVEYSDPNYQTILKALSPGWLRFPGGTESEAFNWMTGEIEITWVDKLTKTNTHDINLAAQPIVAAKGGSSFSEFAAMAKSVNGAKIIVSVNAYTDTKESARALARTARENGNPVAVWELANEPYTWVANPNATPPFPGQFFTDAANYATKMKPYRDAIKAADPNAVVSLYFSEAGTPDRKWDKALANYASKFGKYWDAVTYHEYVHPVNPTSFADLVKAANGNLLLRTTRHVTDYLMHMNEPGPYVISEVSPSPGEAGKGLVLLGTLYGGIYSAEFALRMSTLPQVMHVASYQMLSKGGIDLENDPSDNITALYESNGTVTNTSGYPFGFFLSAQAAAEAVANGALKNSIGVYATTTTGGPTETTDGTENIPAVYAQAYDGGNGKRYVVLTNKDQFSLVARITQNGFVRTSPMDMTFVTGTENHINTNAPDDVQIPPPTVINPGAVTIPPYSVVRLEWTEADTTPPVTTAEAPTPLGSNGWYTAPTVVNFTATDNLSGVLRTDYSMNDGSRWTTGNIVSVSGNAIHKILYRSIDLDGNVETPKSIIIKLDNKPPVTTVSTTPRTFGGLEVNLKAVDNVSGVAFTEFSLDGGKTWKLGEAVFLCGGTFTMLYRSTDAAGNVEKRQSITVSATACAP